MFNSGHRPFLIKNILLLLFVLAITPFYISCRLDGKVNGSYGEHPSVEACSAPNQAKAPYAGGDGSASDPYVICTATQLNALGLSQSDWDKNFIQKADIDLSYYNGSTTEKTFNPIGIGDFFNFGIPFKGTYDGGNYKISNFTFNNTVNNYYTGVFGYLVGATLKNITVEAPNVTSTSKYVGTLVGFVDGGTIDNCHSIGGAVSAKFKVGGLIGYFFAGGTPTVSNSSSSTDVTASGHATQGAIAGGLIGEASNSSFSVSNSYATGSVTATTGGEVGGLIGHLNAGQVSNTYATGDIQANDSKVGGLIGYVSNATISQSYATGDIQSDGNYIGGLIGYVSNATISQSYATGDINNTNASLAGTGGLVGGFNAAFASSITESFAKGNIVSAGPSVGGLIGILTTGSTVSDSYALGDVSGSISIGGLVGFGQGTIIRSYSTGKITGANTFGGLIGLSNSATINDSYSVSEVDSGTDSSGLVGVDSGTVHNNNNYFTDDDNDSLVGTQYIDNNIPVRVKAMASWDITNVWNYRENFLDPTHKWYQPDYCSAANQAKAPYAGGSGIAKDPYVICTALQLNTIGLNQSDWTKYFIVKADIDLSFYDGTTAAKTFNPIGYFNSSPLSNIAFRGSFDGDGYTISNFTYPNTFSATEYAGMFPNLYLGAKLRNIKFNEVNINAPNQTAVGIVGQALSFVEISNIHISGSSSTITGKNSVGSLAGEINVDSHIRDSSSQGVSIYGLGSSTGGLVGSQWSSVIRSFTSNQINCVGVYCGGISGTLGRTILDSYSLSNITSINNYVGGLAGYSSGGSGLIIRSYSSGNLFAPDYIGGIAGDFAGGIGVATSYSTCSITSAGTSKGGLVGFNTGGALINLSFFTGIDNSIGSFTALAVDALDGASSSGTSWRFDEVWKGTYSYPNSNPKLYWEP